VTTKSSGRIYVDACIAIELAKYLLQRHRPDREDALWFVRQMLKASECGDIELMTSSLTVVESLHLGKDEQGKDVECTPEIQEFLVNLLTSGSLITLVEPSLFVAERARDLRWKDGLSLKPFDSLHVASALDSECKELITFDGKMNKKPEEITTLANLGLRVISPHDSQILPESYRQQALALKPPKTPKTLKELHAPATRTIQ